MGQTLTHGIYLPDEGERNCYNGLASNWSILDGAVGTVAEHTTALAGKAPAVHTHTKSDITDFPAYGNTAGTICEGNDSRLSDARTPVAHTHTKADVTDLLNSNFIPSANNSYDLGSASKQWQNTYSKGYYYNGTAWGLDQNNTWTGANIFYKSIQIHGGRNAYIMPEFGASYSGLVFGTVEFKQSFKFGDWVDNNSTIGLNTSNAYVEIYAGLDSSDNINKVRLNPSPNATTAELGTSTNKWKSLNGVNPGALSLPDVSDGDPISTVGWSLTGARNTYTPTENGWFFIRVKGTASTRCSLNIHSGSYNDNYPTWVSFNDPAISLSTSLVVPAQKSVSLYVYIVAAEIEQLIFFPCLGNV